jgi:hypothetical protein
MGSKFPKPSHQDDRPSSEPLRRLGKALRKAVAGAEGDWARLRINQWFEHDLFVGPRADGDVAVDADGIAIVLDRQSARRAHGLVSRNFAAGMSGGVAYVFDEDALFDARCNQDMVELVSMTSADMAKVRDLLQEHQRWIGSRKAGELLGEWSSMASKFVKLVPSEYRMALEAQQHPATNAVGEGRWRTRRAPGPPAGIVHVERAIGLRPSSKRWWRNSGLFPEGYPGIPRRSSSRRLRLPLSRPR